MKLPHRKKPKYQIVLAAAVVCVTGGLIGLWSTSRNPVPILTYYSTSSSQSFPEIDQTQLSDKQKSLIAILKKQYAEPQNGEFYSQGEQQPWCANFVSWVMRENDMAYRNPISGSWRIPGTRTLKDYYTAENAFVSISDNYTPRVGDTTLYQPPSRYGEHVNIVLKVQGGKVTTIGGNEAGQIRISTRDLSDTTGVIGYGKFPG